LRLHCSGVTTADLNAAADEVLKKHGCYSPFKGYGQPPFPASICTSVNEELVHGIPNKKRVLREGDIVSVDSGTVLEGFVADSAFTAGVGEISEDARYLLETTEGALKAATEQMRPVKRTGDIRRRSRLCRRTAFTSREYTSHGRATDARSAHGPEFREAGTGMPLRPE
jgi:methionyl aminopeptidase